MASAFDTLTVTFMSREDYDAMQTLSDPRDLLFIREGDGVYSLAPTIRKIRKRIGLTLRECIELVDLEEQKITLDRRIKPGTPF